MNKFNGDKNKAAVTKQVKESELKMRMAIHVKKVAKKTNIKEQKLETFERSGFTAVEWDGVIH